MLIVVPWSVFWDRNFFVEAVPVLAATLRNNFMRGAVSGIGLINVVAGFVELATLLGTERRRRDLPGRVSIGVADGSDG